METQSSPPPPPPPTKAAASLDDYHSNVDTSRPFRSVKEAVAIFGERILVGEIYTPNPLHYPPCPSLSYNTNSTQFITSSSSSSSIPSPPRPDKDKDHNDNIELIEGSTADINEETLVGARSMVVVLDTLKRLESELEDTKAELKLLKDREQETEVALATLNAELHKNMSRFAQAEATAAAKAVVVASSSRPPAATGSGTSTSAEDQQNKQVVILQDHHHMSMMRSRRRKELMKSMQKQKNTTLAQILRLENDAFFTNNTKRNKMEYRNKTIKKKPIVPLLGDLFFFRKKFKHLLLI